MQAVGQNQNLLEHVYDSLNGNDLARARAVNSFARDFINSSRGNKAGRNNKMRRANPEQRKEADFQAALAQALEIAGGNDDSSKPITIRHYRLRFAYLLYDTETRVFRDGHQSSLQAMLAEVATWDKSDVAIRVGNYGWTIYPLLTPNADRALHRTQYLNAIMYGRENLSSSGRLSRPSGQGGGRMLWFPVDRVPRPQPINRSGWAQ